MQDANVQHVIADLRSADLLDSAGLAATTGYAPAAAPRARGQPRPDPCSPRRHRGRGSRWPDGVQHLSAVDQRVFGLQEVRETVELLETGIGVMLAVRG